MKKISGLLKKLLLSSALTFGCAELANAQHLTDAPFGPVIPIITNPNKQDNEQRVKSSEDQALENLGTYAVGLLLASFTGYVIYDYWKKYN